MSTLNIIRALRDEEYLMSLSAAERAALPQHPAGLIELTDEDLEPAAGGRPSNSNSGIMSPDICCCR